MLLWAAPIVARADYTAVVNPAAVLATNFQGWGSSLCWWANVIGAYSNRNDYADLAFSQLKLNIVRYNIGGGENPSLTNTISNFRAIMQGFEPTNGVWNWNADANQRWMLRAAISRGANLVDAFANSPPWWMTVSGSVTGAVNGTNNLQVAYQTSFANYLATVVSNLSILDGVNFNYLTPMNEPSDAWTYDNGKQEGCHMTPSQQSQVVADLSAALAITAPQVAIDAAEDYSEQDTVNDLQNYSSGSFDDVALISTHTYSANNPSGLEGIAVSSGRPLWVCEYGDGDGTGLTMARRIHDDLTDLGARAWVYWQVVDSASGWGFLDNPLTSDTGPTNYTINEKFYVMGQFSEFIRPGCNIISVSDTNTIAAYNPTNDTLTLVTVNNTASPFNVTYNLSAFSSLLPQVGVFQTASGENLAALPSLTASNQQFTAAIPSESVTTFVLTGLGGIGPSQDAYTANLLSYGPVACWRLNETAGSATAFDLANGYNGVYGSLTTNGQPGAPDPPFLGMPQNNLGVWMDHAGSTNGFINTASINMTLTNATLLCWVYPVGNQNDSEGLVFSRGGTVDGINFGNGDEMAYTWNNLATTYGWGSGLVVPTNQWSMLALVITRSNAVASIFNSTTQASATNAVTNAPVAVNAGFTIGADPQSSTLSTRIFNGEMDDVAVFNYALSAAQLSQIYSIAQQGLTVQIQTGKSGFVVTWPFGALYQSPAANGPWSAVPGATSPYTNTFSGAGMFYRAIARP